MSFNSSYSEQSFFVHAGLKNESICISIRKMLLKYYSIFKTHLYAEHINIVLIHTEENKESINSVH